MISSIVPIPIPQSLVTTELFYIVVFLPFFFFFKSNKWNHEFCNILRLALFTQYRPLRFIQVTAYINSSFLLLLRKSCHQLTSGKIRMEQIWRKRPVLQFYVCLILDVYLRSKWRCRESSCKFEAISIFIKREKHVLSIHMHVCMYRIYQNVCAYTA